MFVVLRASRDRRSEHPYERHLTNWSGVRQADAFSDLRPDFIRPIGNRARSSKRYRESHAERKFFELADIAANARRGKNAPISPIALEAVKRIDAIFEIEREFKGVTAEERLAARRSRARRSTVAHARRVDALWARQALRHNAVAKAIDYMLTRWPALRAVPRRRTHLPDPNNAAEQALRGLALGRKV